MERVDTNPATGSILIIHRNAGEELMGFAAANGIRIMVLENSSLGAATRKAYREVDNHIRKLSGGCLCFGKALVSTLEPGKELGVVEGSTLLEQATMLGTLTDRCKPSNSCP